MQASTQSYGAYTYSQIQSQSLFANPNKSAPSSRQDSVSAQESKPDDPVSLSPDGKKLAEKVETAAPPEEKGLNQKPLTEEELRLVTELKTRDTEVRSHEQAHLSAAGQHAAGGASFSYTTGPNGKRYASSGSVPIDLSKEDTPEATILKMRTVRRAALAPASPSSADRAIAAQASAKETQAIKELQDQQKISTQSEASQESTATEEIDNSRNSETQQAPEASDYSRKTMLSAYQNIAALAA